jgi:hypothetical protein
MSDQTPDEAAFKAAREQSIEEMAELLQDEFAAVSRAAERLRKSSDMAKKLDDDDLLKVLAQLRMGRAMDDFTTIYLDIKDQEAEAAANLLEELEDGADDLDPEYDDFEDEDEYDEFDDLEEFEDDEDDDSEEEEDDDSAAAPGAGYGA